MRKRKFPITVQQLHNEYVVQRLSQRQIADMHGVTQTAVKDAMKRHRIPARPFGICKTKRERVVELRAAGYSWRMIAHLTGLTDAMVYTALKGSPLLGAVTTRYRKPYAAEYPDAEPMIG